MAATLSQTITVASGGANSQTYVPNLNLDTLKNNGGLTPTIALGSGSAALNAGLANCPASDQRGFPRPSANKCDIGAYQYNFGDGSVACTKQMLNQALKVGGYIPFFARPIPLSP
jgi:hypothetical protein